MKTRLIITGFELGQKISAIIAMRNAAQLGLAEAKDFIEGRLPRVLLTDKTREEAMQIAGTFAAAGLRYVVEDDVKWVKGMSVQIIDTADVDPKRIVSSGEIFKVGKTYVLIKVSDNTKMKFRSLDGKGHDQPGYASPRYLIRPTAEIEAEFERGVSEGKPTSGSPLDNQ